MVKWRHKCNILLVLCEISDKHLFLAIRPSRKCDEKYAKITSEMERREREGEGDRKYGEKERRIVMEKEVEREREETGRNEECFRTVVDEERISLFLSNAEVLQRNSIILAVSTSLLLKGFLDVSHTAEGLEDGWMVVVVRLG